MKTNMYELNIQTKCDACKFLIMVDQYGNGDKCPNCGWYQNELGEEYPDRVVFPNVVSLKKAKLLVSEEKTISPSFEDFIGMFMFYGEVEFTYKDVIYDICRTDNEEGMEYGCSPTDISYFENTKDFFANARTFDRKLLKDVWGEVENPKYL